MLVFALLNWGFVIGAPFVATWNTSQANEAIQLPTLSLEPNATIAIDWGDSTTPAIFLANNSANASHVYASAGLHNVSIEGQFRWTWQGSPTKPNLVDIVSWGDGFLVDASSLQLFFDYRNLRVSAPPNTQPVFLPKATLDGMFDSTSFNSSLEWDLTNVTDLQNMFYRTPLNQPINFRNTQNVTTASYMLAEASQFNQPFHFDATNLLTADHMFYKATAFNQVVTLTNSNKLRSTYSMFFGASSFNQPITFNVDSVSDLSSMFGHAISFNQPINFPSTSQLTKIYGVFYNASSFNQPVTLNTSNVNDMRSMFYMASSFASPLNFTSTSKVTDMTFMFLNVTAFDQDLSSWNVSQVTSCLNFCPWCGLPSFSSCVPCDPIYTNNQTNVSVCTNGTRAPTTSAPSRAPTTAAPSAPSVTAAPSVAPSAPSAPSPSGSAVSAAHAVRGETIMLAGLVFIFIL